MCRIHTSGLLSASCSSVISVLHNEKLVLPLIFRFTPGHVPLLHPPPPPSHGHVLIVGRIVGIGHVDVDQVVVIVVVIIIIVVVIVVDVVGRVDDSIHHSKDEAEEAKCRHSAPSSNKK